MSYEDLKQLVIDCEEELKEEFKKIEELEFTNSKKVLDALKYFNVI